MTCKRVEDVAAGALSGPTRWQLPVLVDPAHLLPVPTDGLVGNMLTRMGRHPQPAGRTCMMMEVTGHERLITHIFVLTALTLIPMRCSACATAWWWTSRAMKRGPP